MQKIRKRNGDLVEYKKEKIEKAIASAFDNPDRKVLKRLTQEVEDRLFKKRKSWIPRVEQIQDIVEQILMGNGYTNEAKSFILYRKQHQELRETKDLVTDLSIVDGYLDETNWKVKENSNMSYSLQGLNVHVSEEVISNYWLNKIYPKEIGQAHEKGKFHIHDLGQLSTYCVGWDLKDLLLKGFRGVKDKIVSNPPKHFRTALMQTVNFLFTTQGEVAGANALSHVDTLFAPFIREDNLSYKEIKQCIQELLYNLNVPTRTGFQSPFSNFTLDLTIPDYLAKKSVIIGGDLCDNTYSDYRKEVRQFNKAFAEVMIEGDAEENPFTFPIPTYNITKDFNWNDPMLKPIWEMTAKYGTPYFSNFINSDMKPEDSRSLCCRLRLSNRELKKRGGGLFGSNPKTGSIGVVTIDLPRIGYETSSKSEFLDQLENVMNLAKESLIIKRKTIESLTKSGLYPYSRFYLSDVKEAMDGYWKNHFSTIGLIGMNDALLNLLDTDIGTKEGQEFAEETLSFMRKRIKDYQKETGDVFNLEATPAEGTSYRLAKIDKEKYPDIKIYNQTQYGGKEPYYTNSSQLPVGYTDDIFEALDLQNDLQTKYTGGTVFHGFLGESMPNIEATKKLVKRIAENYEIPYYTLTPTFSICPSCGYINGECYKCPDCGKETKVYSRVVGYLRPVQNWNKGKTQEFKERKTFT